MNKLLVENAELIGRTPNWIIDLRSNEGGSDYVYARLIDYLYTRPIYRIDYSNTNKIPLPSGRFELYYPISRSLRLRKNRSRMWAFQPIPIPETEEDPVQFVERSLREQ